MRDAYPIAKNQEFQLIAATLFNSRLRRILYSYKFSQQRQYTRILTDVMIHYWQAFERQEKYIVIPIPARNKQRAHVYPIAKRFANHFGYEYKEALLLWKRETDAQHHIHSKKVRFENIHQSLVVTPESTTSVLQAHPILLLDDITTTGATLREAYRAIKTETIPMGQVTALALTHVPLAFL
jgi:competence protein ComFC